MVTEPGLADLLAAGPLGVEARASAGSGHLVRPAAGVVQQPAALAAQAALAGRWQLQGGDFFRAVPAGADTCVRKRASCTTGATRSAGRVAPGRRARLRVVDAVLPGGNAPHPAKVMGIVMMVFGSGRERTPAEFAARRTRAGRRLDAARGSASPLSVAEAVPD